MFSGARKRETIWGKTTSGRRLRRKQNRHYVLLSLDHSHLSVIIGSIFVARHAGIQQANKATSVSASPITTNVRGSVVLTPNSKAFSNRVSASALASPILTPKSANLIP